MFRSMRRSKQVLSERETVEILEKGTSGVLAVSGDDRYPYAVPISYVYADGKIYFHSAAAGHKIDAMRRNEKVSFSVIGQDQIVPDEFTTYFRSAIAFGKVRIIEDVQEKKDAIRKLAVKYSPMPELKKALEEEIESQFKPLTMIEMTIDHLSGKEAIELVRAKNKK